MMFGNQNPIYDISANLAASLIEVGLKRLGNIVLGDDEQRALVQVWNQAFYHLFKGASDKLSKDEINWLDAIFRDFINSEGVSEILLGSVLETDYPIPFDHLEKKFYELGFNKDNLNIGFNDIIIKLVEGLVQSLPSVASQPGNPLYNKVSLFKLASIFNLIEKYHVKLDDIYKKIFDIEKQVSVLGVNRRVEYLGPVSGYKYQNSNQVKLPVYLQNWLDEIVNLLNKRVDFISNQPYSDSDLKTYLSIIINACDTIRLPYSDTESVSSLPLEYIYVSLEADISSPIERKASNRLFQQLLDERSKGKGDSINDDILYQVASYDPYAARYLIFNPDIRQELASSTLSEHNKTYKITEIIQEYRWAILLGHPGSGKTTISRWLALKYAKSLLEGSEIVEIPYNQIYPESETNHLEPVGPCRLPILINIADYASTRWPAPGVDEQIPLENYMGIYFRSVNVDPLTRNKYIAIVQDYLSAGKACFILDGLDEVIDQHQRNSIAAEIENLIRSWIVDPNNHTPLDPGYIPTLAFPGGGADQGGNQIIVTSRIVGYQIRPLHENLPHFVVQPLDDTAVKSFCRNWTRAMNLVEHNERLAVSVLSHPNLNVKNEMGRNPLMLTILAQVYTRDPVRGLPTRPASLYEESVRAVFGQRPEHWGKLSTYLGGSDLEKALLRISSYLAFQLLSHPTTLGDEQSVRKWITKALDEEPALLLNRRKEDIVTDFLVSASNLSGFFIARGKGVYGFLHRQFQEFFAAKYLIRLCIENDNWDSILERISFPNWREVIYLVIGILLETDRGKALELINTILKSPDPTRGLLPHNLLLVSSFLVYIDNPPVDLVGAIALGLIGAYTRTDKHRFSVMKTKVASLFSKLPRSINGYDVVGKKICDVLSGELPNSFSSETDPSLYRFAAIELVASSKWYTNQVIDTISKFWKTNSVASGLMLHILDDAYKSGGQYWEGTNLPMRVKLKENFHLWDSIIKNSDWVSIFHAFYLSSGSDISYKSVIRDTSLTNDLSTLLEVNPENRKALEKILLDKFRNEDRRSATWRDATIALVYMGNDEVLNDLCANNNQSSSVISCLYFDLTVDYQPKLTQNRYRLIELIDNIPSLTDKLGRKISNLPSTFMPLTTIPDKDLKETCINIDLYEFRDFEFSIENYISFEFEETLDTLRKLIIYLEQITNQSNTKTDLLTKIDEAKIIALNLYFHYVKYHYLSSFWNLFLKRLSEMKSGGYIDQKLLKNTSYNISEVVNYVLNHIDNPKYQKIIATLRLPRLNLSSSSDYIKLLDKKLSEAISNENHELAKHYALFMFELGVIRKDTLPYLLDCINSEDDLTRYRAQYRMLYPIPSSKIDFATANYFIEKRFDDNSSLGVRSALGQVILNIHHINDSLIRYWIEKDEVYPLQHIINLEINIFPQFIEFLRSSSPKVKTALLFSTARVLHMYREKNIRIPSETEENLIRTLIEISSDKNEEIQEMALYALAFSPNPPKDLVDYLVKHQNLYSLVILARLNANVENIARKKLPDKYAATALCRLIIQQLKQEFDSTSIKRILLSEINDSQLLLTSLLNAGSDYELWSKDEKKYFDTVVNVLVELIKTSDYSMLNDLLTNLERHLQGSDPWNTSRIALACVSACAKEMPDTLNTLRSREEIEHILIQGCSISTSSETRQFAVSSLGYLHKISTNVLNTILAASYDFVDVQQTAIDAASMFRHFADDIFVDNSLSIIETTLLGKSGSKASIAVKLLTALGNSPASFEIKNFRYRVAEIISSGLQNADIEKEVFFLDQELGIVSGGSLAEILWDSLIKVWGIPE